MESMSSSKSQSIYDVFLSFRGEDTRNTFTSHLYSALRNAGIHTFIDNDGLRMGEQLLPSLVQAIEGSRISIVVFSRNYAGSSWCLRELEKVIECHRTTGQVVLPVFYDVKPTDVRKQKGTFGKLFEGLIKRSLTRTSKELDWRAALTKAANLKGWEVESSRPESGILKNIVEHVSMILDSTYLFIADHPVGVESRVQEVIQRLSWGLNDVRIIGIWGMGGSGKTTIAKAIYNKIGRHFEEKSFLENIREFWEQIDGRVNLQQHLLSDLIKTNNEKMQSIEQGKIILKQRLCRKSVFVVLDDVSDRHQLNALCGSREWFGPGTRLVVTTRNKDLLTFLKVDSIYEMRNMDERESFELFSWHAFKQASPSEDFIDLSRDVVSYSGGLPLAFEVLGSLLFERPKELWERVLEKLKRIPNHDIQKKLKISFDGLGDYTEKEIFLDISCFFIKMDRNYVIQILNECGLFADIGINTLIERSLVTVDIKNKLRMHDLLRDMGREIIRETSPKELGEHSRLWIQEEVLEVLTEHTGTKAVEGLALTLPSNNTVRLDTKAFEKMNRLRLLKLGNLKVAGDCEYFSKDLRWLCWHQFPSEFIPGNFYQENLVVIDLQYSNLKVLWKDPQLLKKLKVLNLSHSRYLTETPNFSKVPNLEELILKDCPSLSMVDETIGNLDKLLLVNLEDCTCLSNLPRSFYKLKSLKTLNLKGCSNINKLEEDLEQMESLTTLVADNTAITQVPFSILRMKNIGFISLCGYKGLTRDVFPSLIWFWMSPLVTPQSLVQGQGFGRVSSLALLDAQENSLHNLSLIPSDLPELWSLRVQCRSKLELTQAVARILKAFHAANCRELDITLNASQILRKERLTSVNCRELVDVSASEEFSSSFIIQMGQCNNVTTTLKKRFLQESTTGGCGDYLLPGDNYPDWLAYMDEGSSVLFDVPQPQVSGSLRGMTLCLVYSSCLNNIASKDLMIFSIINHTKDIVQLYKPNADGSFEDEKWEAIKSSLEPGDSVEVIAVFGEQINVKKMAIYLVYGESFDVNLVCSSASVENGTVECLSAQEKNDIIPGCDERVWRNPMNNSGGTNILKTKVSFRKRVSNFVKRSVKFCSRH